MVAEPKPRAPERNHPDIEAAFRAVPPNLVAEILNGQLHVSPRPAARHTNVASSLGEILGGPFRRGRGGPGGWVILDEPELHLGTRPDKLVPDLAGWRRERWPDDLDAPAIMVPPDWICEVLSASTEVVDRGEKMAIYARENVTHAWLIDPVLRTLEVYKLENGRWTARATHRDLAVVRAEPFDAIEIELSMLWSV
jgi:Uma2 family endonuclease